MEVVGVVGRRIPESALKERETQEKRYSVVEEGAVRVEMLREEVCAPWLPSRCPWLMEKCYAGLGGDDDDVLLMNAE